MAAVSVGLVQGDDVWPAGRERRVATHGAVVSVALSQRAGGDDAADAAAGRAAGAVRACHHRGQGVHIDEVARRASVLEEMAERILLIQGGDHGRAVMLPGKGKPRISSRHPQNLQPQSPAALRGGHAPTERTGRAGIAPRAPQINVPVYQDWP